LPGICLSVARTHTGEATGGELRLAEKAQSVSDLDVGQTKYRVHKNNSGPPGVTSHKCAVIAFPSWLVHPRSCKKWDRAGHDQVVVGGNGGASPIQGVLA